jgi:hypothetical protein
VQATMVVQQYINAVRNAITAHAANATADVSQCDSPGIDQGFSNYLVHSGQLSYLTKSKKSTLSHLQVCVLLRNSRIVTQNGDV